MAGRTFRIGTRGSPLALLQAHETRDRLIAAHGLHERDFEIVVIKTSGDRILDRPLAEVGGKGLFTKEIEEALAEGAIDLAVHSMKDVATVLPDGLVIPCVLPREDVRDAFLSLKAARLADLPAGAVVGTASLRRQAQVRRLRPDLRVAVFRGNVQTRLRKLGEGEADATLLAVAGLKRLGMLDRASSIIEPDEMLPAVAQGAIGIEIRADDGELDALLAAIADARTATELAAERAFLARLDGSCRTPIAGLARLEGGRLAFTGMILSPDGSSSHEITLDGGSADAARLGDEAARTLLERAGQDFLAGHRG
ncbi:MAG: hydroxymethylbilane synthase [Hyphomicrobiaceae bacterium]